MKNIGIVRKRSWLLIWLVIVIITGIVSRKYPILFPSCFGKYPGDVLWTLMVYLIWGLIRPGSSIGMIAVLALVTSYLDEFSQFYQAPWINAVRHTFIGHALLGSWFSWIDMAAYTIGAAIGSLVEILVFKRLSINGS